MKTSKFFISTLKEVPAEAEVVSHRLMLRAGLIRRLAAGIYTWLPLGLKVLRKVETIVREEMNRAGAVELIMPVVQPAELWQESGRWQAYGPELLRLKDRHERDFMHPADLGRGDHRHRARRAEKLPPPAGALLPHPDQVPRRAPAALRRHARARVRHEGWLLLPCGLRRSRARVPKHARHVHAHLHAPGPAVPRRGRGYRRDRRHRFARIPRARRIGRGRDRLFPGVRLRR